MTFQEYLEQNEETLRVQLCGADSADAAGSVLDRFLGHMLVSCNEQTEDLLVQECTGAIIRILRLSPGLMDVHGKVNIWQRLDGQDPGSPAPSTGKPGSRPDFVSLLCLIAGVALSGIGLLYAVVSMQTASRLFPVILCWGAGSVLLFLSGLRIRSCKTAPSRDALTGSVTYDPDKILRQLRRMLIGADHTLEELTSSVRSAQTVCASDAQNLSKEEDLLTLSSGLLEALYSQDGDYALEELKQVRHFLHRHGIELSSDTDSHREWFEFIPAAQPDVFRPALIQAETDTLLKKGLAGCSEQA